MSERDNIAQAVARLAALAQRAAEDARDLAEALRWLDLARCDPHRGLAWAVVPVPAEPRPRPARVSYGVLH